MGIAIKNADLVADKETMMKVLLRNRTKYQNDKTFEQRYDWLYHKNPHGPAAAWLVVDDKKDEVVGFTSAFPRRMSVFGEDSLAWNCADFSIDQAYRVLGVAIKLRRAAKNGVDSGDMPFLYAHPNDRMLVIHQKVGHHAIGHMKRYAALLRVDKMISQRVKHDLASSVLRGVGNPLLKFASPSPRKKDAGLRCEFAVNDTFGEEFSDLYEQAKDVFPVIGCRDAEYLNWRYTENPLQTFETLKFYHQGRLAGYCIFDQQGDVAHIADFLAVKPDELIESMLAELFSWLRERRVATASIKLHTGNVLLPHLLRFGFQERDDATSTVIAYAPESSPFAEAVTKPGNWFMTVGDRDV